MNKEILIQDELYKVEIVEKNDHSLRLKLGKNKYDFELVQSSQSKLVLKYKNRQYGFYYKDNQLRIEAIRVSVSVPKRIRHGQGKSANQGGLSSPMPGKILKIMVAVGDSVTSGDPLIVMEAMKMEHTIKAPADGIINSLHCEEGSLVEGGISLIEIDSAKGD